jgi:hypothetical protein
MRALVALAILAVVSGAAAPTANYVPATDCGYVDFDCAGNGHRLVLFAENNKNFHGYCIGPCDPYEGGGVCHPVCRDTFSDEPELEAGYLAMIAAANEGDVASILSHAARFPKHVGFNDERRAVQILNCDGTAVVASLPLRGDDALKVAETLPDAEKMFMGRDQQ